MLKARPFESKSASTGILEVIRIFILWNSVRNGFTSNAFGFNPNLWIRTFSSRHR